MNIRQSMMTTAVLCLTAVAANAEWERTVNAWDTRLPAQGRLQVQIWGSYFEWGEDTVVDGSDYMGRVYLDYGISDSWSVCLAPAVAGWDVDGGDSESGLFDTQVMTTCRFLDEAKGGVDLAVMARVSLPTGDDRKGLGSGHVEPEINMLASKTVGPVVLVANAGVTLIPGADPDEEGCILAAIIEGVYPVSPELSINASVTAATADSDDADDPVDVGAGLRYNAERMFVAGAFYKCLNDAYDWGVQIATGFEF